MLWKKKSYSWCLTSKACRSLGTQCLKIKLQVKIECGSLGGGVCKTSYVTCIFLATDWK